MKQLMLAMGLASSLALAAGPGTALAHRHYRYEHRYEHHYYHHASYRSCAAQHRRSGRIGAVAGMFGGGIIGGALGHGRFAPIALGAGLGALTGHAIGRNVDHC